MLSPCIDNMHHLKRTLHLFLLASQNIVMSPLRCSLWWSWPFIPTTWSSHSLRRTSGFKDLDLSTLTWGLHVENHPLHVMPFMLISSSCVVQGLIPISLGSSTCVASCPHVPLKYLLISHWILLLRQVRLDYIRSQTCAHWASQESWLPRPPLIELVLGPPWMGHRRMF